MGAFPNLSRNVPFCPRLSSFVPICPRFGPQEAQKRTNRDKMGHFGTNWETPPFSIYPHLALFKYSLQMLDGEASLRCAGEISVSSKRGLQFFGDITGHFSDPLSHFGTIFCIG